MCVGPVGKGITMLVQAIRRALADAITMEYQGVCPECLEVTTGHKFFHGARAVADKHVCKIGQPLRIRVVAPDGKVGYGFTSIDADHVSILWTDDGMVTRYNNTKAIEDFGFEVTFYRDYWWGNKPLPE